MLITTLCIIITQHLIPTYHFIYKTCTLHESIHKNFKPQLTLILINDTPHNRWRDTTFSISSPILRKCMNTKFLFSHTLITAGIQTFCCFHRTKNAGNSAWRKFISFLHSLLPHHISTHVRVPQNIIHTYQYICRVTNLACICTPLWAENYICMEIHDFICIGESNSTNHGSSFTNTISFFFFFFHISSAVFVHEIRLSFSFHSSQHSTAMYK